MTKKITPLTARAARYISAPLVDAKGKPLKAGALKAGRQYDYRWNGDLKAFVIETTKRARKGRVRRRTGGDTPPA